MKTRQGDHFAMWITFDWLIPIFTKECNLASYPYNFVADCLSFAAL